MTARPGNGAAPAKERATILEVEGLRKWFPIRRGLLRRVVGHVRAVDDVSFAIARGETVSLVGESRLRQDHHLALHSARARARPRARSASAPKLAARSTSRPCPSPS